MLSFDQALISILRNTQVLAAEKTGIEDSVGRILKEDIYSGLDMPPFDKSAVDGYAVCALDTQDAPVKLRCIGVIPAGEGLADRLNRGECAKIMTGAPLPKGADSVVMVEHTCETAGSVEMLKPVKKGENVCFKGEDLQQNKRVFSAGRRILCSDIAVLAAIGRRFIKVIRLPTAAILNTGGEIVPSGEKLSRGQIYNSNGPQLTALLRADGIEPGYPGIVQDSPGKLMPAVRKGLNSDILLISGGVSMGDYDLVPGILKRAGVKKIFHKVNIKPGKPLFFGVKNKTLIFGIPGNPVSNFLAYFVFIRPAIHKMLGLKSSCPAFKQGILKSAFRHKTGRTHFVLISCGKKQGKLYVNPVPCHGSADVLALSKADGFMMVNEDEAVIRKNTKMQFITWKEL